MPPSTIMSFPAPCDSSGEAALVAGERLCRANNRNLTKIRRNGSKYKFTASLAKLTVSAQNAGLAVAEPGTS